MFSVVFLLFFVMGAANAKQQVPSTKPVKVKPVAAPVGKPVISKPTKPVAAPIKPVKSPTSKPTKRKPTPPTPPAPAVVWSNDIADFSTFYPATHMDEVQEQFVNCKGGKDVVQMYGQRGTALGSLKSFGVVCGAFGGGKWRVLGPNNTPSLLHLSWPSANKVTQLVVYKYLDPVLNYYVVTSLEVYFNGDNTGTIVPASKWTPSPLCNAASDTCTVETTTAAPGESLSYWYFKIINNAADTPNLPGNLLEMKVSATAYTEAPV